MISWGQAGALALACALLIAIPGPSVMFVVGRALSSGRTAALASVLGNAIGCYLVGVAIAFGLGPLLERSEALFQIIKWAGIVFLIWLGIQTIRHARPLPAAAAEPAPALPLVDLRHGIVVGLTNPKPFIMFTALVPQFINPEVGNTPVQMLILGLVPLLIGLLTDSAWAVAAGRARRWLTRSPQRMTTLGRVGGLAIISVGIATAATGDRH